MPSLGVAPTTRCNSLDLSGNGIHTVTVSRLQPAATRGGIVQGASRGSEVGIEAAARQPTMRREYASVTNAVNAIADQVGT